MQNQITKKQKLLEALDYLKKKLGTDFVETKQEVSESVSLDSKDFFTLADSSAGGTCMPEVRLFRKNKSLDRIVSMTLPTVSASFNKLLSF